MITHKLICNPFFSDHSYFSYLPDEIVLLILSKIIDLKTLCRCKLVSTQFNLIVHQVHTVSFVANSPADNPSPIQTPPMTRMMNFLKRFCIPLSNPSLGGPAASYDCESFRSAIQSVSKFTRLKSLCIELPSTRQAVDNGSDLYKWKVKFGSKVESFAFLSPNSVYNTAGLSNVNEIVLEQEQNLGLDVKKFRLAYDCLRDAMVRFRMLMGYIVDFPLLENVLITQSGKRGSVSISGRNVVEMRKWLCSPADGIEQKLNDSTESPCLVTLRYTALLKLPVSGYVMKGVTLVMFQRKDLRDGDDSFMNINLNDFEDKEEAAYGEAVMEMLKKFRSRLI